LLLELQWRKTNMVSQTKERKTNQRRKEIERTETYKMQRKEKQATESKTILFDTNLHA